MKTFYKKALITLIATILIEIIIVYFLYTSISAFYADLTKKTAFLLVEQVKNVLNIDNLDLSKLSPYNKNPNRLLLKKFSSRDSEILHVLLIDTTHQIILSDDPSVEGKYYTDESEIDLLRGEEAKVVNKKWEGNLEILDVIHPLVRDSVKQGYLRTIISLKHLQNFYQNRRIILVVASLFTFTILIITVFLTSRIYQTELLNIEKAIEKLNKDDFKHHMDYRKRDEFEPVFSGLNQLFDKATGWNESYKKSEEKIKAILQVIHEGLMIVDEKMKIISYNQYLLDIFQTKNRSNPEEELYQILMKNPKLVEAYRRAKDPLTHSVKRSFTIQLLTGNTIDVQISAFSIFEGETSRNIIIYVKNIGMLQELDQIVHRSMMYNIISKLSSSIGHEVRNPLSSLAIHTEVLDNLSDIFPVNGNHYDKFKKSLKILKSEIGRLTKIFDQFFNLTRSKEISLSYEDINSIIREVMELVHQEAYEKSVELSYHLGKNLPRVNVNRDQIKQVILNIILNAYDAMPNGGKLEIISKEQDNKVIVEFSDTGKGIPEKNTDKIFDLYFSTKKDGTGVGLSFSKEVIDAHEGKIYFTSKANQGTTFYVELPRS
jgi:signal transduction histidine kinase